MRVLLINPEFPDTYWSFRHALPFEGKRCAFPPLGLLTVSALLPPDWERRLIDLNVESLKAADIEWADMVFATAMLVQKDSLKQVVKRCKSFGKRVVAQTVLASELFRDPRERLSDAEHRVAAVETSAGRLGQLVQVPDRALVIAHSAADRSTRKRRTENDSATSAGYRYAAATVNRTGSSRRVVINGVDRRVRLFGETNRAFVRTAVAGRVDTVREQHDRFATRDRVQLFLENLLDCVVERSEERRVGKE